MVAESGTRPSLFQIMLTRSVEFRRQPDYIDADYRPSQSTTLIGPNGQANSVPLGRRPMRWVAVADRLTMVDRVRSAPVTTVSITPNSGPQSPSGSDGADQSADSPLEDFQDATYTPVQPTTVLSSNGQPMGVQMGSSGDGSRLNGLMPIDLAQISRKDIDSALPNTNWESLSDDSKQWLLEHKFGPDALQAFGDKANSDSVQAELAEGYALSGLSQAVMRDVGPPTAVQVRISAPDKL